MIIEKGAKDLDMGLTSLLMIRVLNYRFRLVYVC